MANYNLNGTIRININTTLEDTEIPTEETLKFLIEEDLQNIGYDINEIRIIDFKRKGYVH